MFFLLFILIGIFTGNTVEAQNEHNVWLTTANQEYIYNGVSEETTPHLYGTLHDPEDQVDSWFEASASVYNMDGNHIYNRAGIQLGGDSLNIRWNLGNQVLEGQSYTLVFNLIKWNEGWSTYEWFTSDTAVITIDYLIVTDVEEIEPSNFSVYPNPASDQITITGMFDQDELIFVFDPAGKLIMSIPANGLKQINVSSLSPGMYTVRTSKENLFTKFIKV